MEVVCMNFFFSDVLDSDGELIVPTNNITANAIIVKAKDIVRNTFTTKLLIVPIKRYTGNFTLTVPNVFTPNGDGYNDNFRITDKGKTRFAYNAFRYKLFIWNSWGNQVLLKENEVVDDDINGFNDQEIYWNGRNENETTTSILAEGTYYYNFYLANCDHDKELIIQSHGSITLTGTLGKTTILETNKDELKYIRKTEISPNPTNNILNVKLFSTKTKTDILITDMLGKPINTTSNLTADKDGLQEYNIDCSGMANGIYFCTVTKGNTLETFKFSVIK